MINHNKYDNSIVIKKLCLNYYFLIVNSEKLLSLFAVTTAIIAVLVFALFIPALFGDVIRHTDEIWRSISSGRPRCNCRSRMKFFPAGHGVGGRRLVIFSLADTRADGVYVNTLNN